jgi:hypothetical protein
MLDLAQEGDGPTAWRVHLGIFKNVFDNLAEDYPEFHNAVKKAEELHLLYWEREGRRISNTGKGGQNVYAFLMANKFGMRVKNDVAVVATVEQTSTVKNAELTGDELRKQLEARGLPTTILIDQDDIEDGQIV